MICDQAATTFFRKLPETLSRLNANPSVNARIMLSRDANNCKFLIQILVIGGVKKDARTRTFRQTHYPRDNDDDGQMYNFVFLPLLPLFLFY